MIKIENKNPEKIKLFQDMVDSYMADYGNLKKGSDSNFTVRLTSEQPFKDIKVRTSCGSCTKAKHAVINETTVDINIWYDSTKLGRIIKSVKFTAQEQKVEIKIRGRIDNN